MKTILRVFLIMLISSFMLSACKKTESGDNSLLMLLLGGSDGTFTKEVALTTSTSFQGGTFSTSTFRHYQIMYKPGDLTGSGNIKSIYFRYYYDTSPVSCPNVTIKLGHTDAADLSALEGTDMGLNINNGEGSAVTVLDNKTVLSPGGNAGEYFEIPLDTKFHYNGFDNLVVDVLRTSACNGSVLLTTGAGPTTYTSMAFSTNSATPDTTGSANTNILHMKFKFEGGDNSIRYTDSNLLTNLNEFPFNTTPYKVQLLYTAGEINGSGYITGIGFPVGTNPRGGTTASEVTYTINVKLGHTSLTELTTSFANNFDKGTPSTMANTVAFTVPAGIPDGTYIWIPVPDGMFNYNGTDNLIVEIQSTALASIVTRWIKDDSGINTQIYASDIAAPDGVKGTQHSFTKFRFKGSTMDVIDGGGSFVNVFTSSTDGRQFLLRSVELGTAGSITKLAFRAYATTTSDSYPYYTVILAHATQSALVATDANNISEGTVVYIGTFNMPAGLLKGDWIEIPFSTPFIYNGIDNLVIQTSTSAGGSTTQACQVSLPDATLFPDLWKALGGYSPQDNRGVFKFWVNK